MIVLTAESYAQFKDLATFFGGTEGAAIHFIARNGTAQGTGFSIMGYHESQQMVVRWMDTVKPPTFDTDYPKAKYVRDFTVV